MIDDYMTILNLNEHGWVQPNGYGAMAVAKCDALAAIAILESNIVALEKERDELRAELSASREVLQAALDTSVHIGDRLKAELTKVESERDGARATADNWKAQHDDLCAQLERLVTHTPSRKGEMSPQAAREYQDALERGFRRNAEIARQFKEDDKRLDELIEWSRKRLEKKLEKEEGDEA